MIYLRQGLSRPTVTSLQVMLGHVRPDGIFGPRTCDAVHAYQRKHRPHLGDDGIVGRHTWKSLMSQNRVETVDVVDADELVDEDATSNNWGHRIPHPENTFTGDVLLGFKSAGSHPIMVYGQCNGVAAMVAQVTARVGAQRRLVLLRIYGHGHDGSQKVSGGKLPAEKDEDLMTIQAGNASWWSPLLSSLKQHFVPWGSIELHGCDVASGSAGHQLLSMIARTTGVPVTAAVREQYGNCTGQWTFSGPTVTAFPYGADLKGWSHLAAAKSRHQ
jgi:hypothetical protein